MQEQIISVDAFNNKAAKHEEDTYLQEREHWDNLRDDLGYETILDLQELGMMPLDKKLFKDRPYLVTYKVISFMGENIDVTTWLTVTAGSR